jgi:hypothetical protein
MTLSCVTAAVVGCVYHTLLHQEPVAISLSAWKEQDTFHLSSGLCMKILVIGKARNGLIEGRGELN